MPSSRNTSADISGPSVNVLEDWRAGGQRVKEGLEAASQDLLSASRAPEVSDAILRKPNERGNAEALAGIVQEVVSSRGGKIAGCAWCSSIVDTNGSARDDADRGPDSEVSGRDLEAGAE